MKPEPNIPLLIFEARRMLGLHSDADFATFLGVSRRTIQRYKLHSHGFPSHDGAVKFVRQLFAADPDTARTLSRALRVDISDLEPAPPTASVSQQPMRQPVDKGAVAMLVLAVHDAVNLPPREVRSLLSTVFREALALRVDLNEMAQLLAKEPTGAGSPAAG